MVSNSGSFQSKSGDFVDVSNSPRSNSPRSTSAGGSSARSVDTAVRPSENCADGLLSPSASSFDILDAELAESCRESEQGMPAMRTSAAQASKSVTSARGTLIIRNTFIDEATCRPASLDEFFKEREIRSCPASRQQSALSERLLDIIEEAVMSADASQSVDCVALGQHGIDVDATSCDHAALDAKNSNAGSDLLTKLRCDGTKVLEQIQHASIALGFDTSKLPGGVSSGFDWDWFSYATAAQAQPSQWSPQMEDQGRFSYECSPVPSQSGPRAPPAPMPYDVPIIPPPEMPQPFSGALPPQRDANVLPSVGSALHGTGECKPCWFVHKRGCTNGQDCALCHLCPPGEWKRRRHQRRAEVEKAARAAAAEAVDTQRSDIGVPCSDNKDRDIMSILNAAFSQYP